MSGKKIVSCGALILLIAFMAPSCDSTTVREQAEYVVCDYFPDLRTSTGCSMDGSSADDIWFIRVEEIWHYDGTSWSRQYYEQGVIFNAITCLDDNHVWAAGEDFTPGREESRSYVYFYDDTGWSKQFECDGLSWDISAFDSEHVWLTAPGVSSGVYFYDGKQWSEMPPVPDDEYLTSICASGPTEVWGGTPSGSIYEFDGSAWNKSYQGSDMIQDIAVLDHDRVWAASGSIGSTGTGCVLFYDGTCWNVQLEAENGQFTSLDVKGPQSVWATCNINRGKTYLGDNEVDIPEGRLYYSEGRDWDAQWQEYPEMLEDMYVQDAGHIWMVSVTSGVYLLGRP